VVATPVAARTSTAVLAPLAAVAMQYVAARALAAAAEFATERETRELQPQLPGQHSAR